jgi:hypothetical protein
MQRTIKIFLFFLVFSLLIIYNKIMETIFDTYAFITKLKEAGMPEQQAVVMSDTIKQVEQSTSDNIKQVKQSTFDTIKQSEQSKSDVLATKADVQAVRTELKADILQVKTELKAEILQVKAELSGQIMLLRWMLGFVLAGIVSIIFKLFFTP